MKSPCLGSFDENIFNASIFFHMGSLLNISIIDLVIFHAVPYEINAILCIYGHYLNLYLCSCVMNKYSRVTNLLKDMLDIDDVNF